MKPEIRDVIMAGLKDAVLPGGIGTAARRSPGYGGIEVAGKTGTAEVFGKQDTSVFVGIVNPPPALGADEPQYVVAVFVEQGGAGGSVAAPIARRIADALSGDIEPARACGSSRRQATDADGADDRDLGAAACAPRRTRPHRRRRTILDADTTARLDWVLIGACLVARRGRARDDLLGVADRSSRTTRSTS